MIYICGSTFYCFKLLNYKIKYVKNNISKLFKVEHD